VSDGGAQALDGVLRRRVDGQARVAVQAGHTAHVQDPACAIFRSYFSTDRITQCCPDAWACMYVCTLSNSYFQIADGNLLDAFVTH
jgi:hypothetical protein